MKATKSLFLGENLNIAKLEEKENFSMMFMNLDLLHIDNIHFINSSRQEIFLMEESIMQDEFLPHTVYSMEV